MSDISDLKNAIRSGTMALVLLTLASAGIYPVVWLDRNNEIISAVTRERIVDERFAVWLATCFGLAVLLSSASDLRLRSIGLMLYLAASGFYVVWAFRAKAALEKYCRKEFNLNLKMNALYTFMANIYYVNQCINDLPELDHVHQCAREPSILPD